MVTWGVTIFFLTLSIDLITDYRLWKLNRPINHRRGAWLRCIGLIPAIILISWKATLIIGFGYWFLFDGLFNVIRGRNWWYVGTEADTDKLLQNLTKTQQKILKFGCIILGCALLAACITPRSTEGLRDALPNVTPQQDTICLPESYDWFHHEYGVHINCQHDK